MADLRCGCACGRSNFTLTRLPTRRFFCHCEICQSVYEQPYADALVTSARTIIVDPISPLEYRHLNGANSIDRGICESCAEPTIGFLKLMPGVRLAFVPARSLKAHKNLPNPAMHIFYESRSADVADDLPKFETPSQSLRACTWPFLAGFAGL